MMTKQTGAEKYITPILMCLNNLVKEGAFARSYLKMRVFGDLADPCHQPPDLDESNLSQAEVNKRKMEPKGPKLDHPEEVGTMRALLIKHVTSFNYNVKSSVSEFLYSLCKEDSNEYLRLVGFGAGVGLLADKGMPGFGHFTQNAISLDDLMKAKKNP